MVLLTIDVGGTSIKYASFDKGQLANKGSKATPQTLESFYKSLQRLKMKSQNKSSSQGSPLAVQVP